MSKEAEILTEQHRIITPLKILKIDDDNKELYTLIPRNFFNRPIPFCYNTVYNVIYNNGEIISFYQVYFSKVDKLGVTPCYLFTIKNVNSIYNARTEERNSVELEAVFSNFERIGLATVLDMSPSGLKIQTKEKIDSEFIEIFFDDHNVPKQATAKIVWNKEDEESGYYIYGLKANYR